MPFGQLPCVNVMDGWAAALDVFSGCSMESTIERVVKRKVSESPGQGLEVAVVAIIMGDEVTDILGPYVCELRGPCLTFIVPILDRVTCEEDVKRICGLEWYGTSRRRMGRIENVLENYLGLDWRYRVDQISGYLEISVQFNKTFNTY